MLTDFKDRLETVGEIKKGVVHSFGCASDYENRFFTPFTSFNDAKCNTKAIIIKPAVAAALALRHAGEGLLSIIVGLVDLTLEIFTLDPDKIGSGFSRIGSGISKLIDTCCYVVSILTDCLDSLLRLATHSLCTIGMGFYKTGQAIGNCFVSKPEATSLMTGQ